MNNKLSKSQETDGNSLIVGYIIQKPDQFPRDAINEYACKMGEVNFLDSLKEAQDLLKDDPDSDKVIWEVQLNFVK